MNVSKSLLIKNFERENKISLVFSYYHLNSSPEWANRLQHYPMIRFDALAFQRDDSNDINLLSTAYVLRLRANSKLVPEMTN